MRGAWSEKLGCLDLRASWFLLATCSPSLPSWQGAWALSVPHCCPQLSSAPGPGLTEEENAGEASL